MERNDELRHLRVGPATADVPVELVRYLVLAADSAAVVDRATVVMRRVLELDDRSWPELDVWTRALPAWFVDGCAAEVTPRENRAWLRRWRGLDTVARGVAESRRGWSLRDWLSWLEPAERQWFWWDAADYSDHSEVVVEVHGWPYADGALRWLLEVAGATSVEADRG